MAILSYLLLFKTNKYINVGQSHLLLSLVSPYLWIFGGKHTTLLHFFS